MSTPVRFRSAILVLPGGAALYGTRVFAKQAPDDLAGAVWIVLHRLSSTREAAHDGDGKMMSVLFQVDVGGGVREQVETVKQFLLENLNGHTYEDGTGSIVSLFEGELDDYDDEHRSFLSRMTFTVLDNNA